MDKSIQIDRKKHLADEPKTGAQPLGIPDHSGPSSRSNRATRLCFENAGRDSMDS